METKEGTPRRKRKNVESTSVVVRQQECVPTQRPRKSSSKDLIDASQVIHQTPSRRRELSIISYYRDNTLKTDEMLVVGIDHAKKSKKRKRKDTENDYKSPQGEKEGESIQKFSAKKRKNRTELPDPREDPALNNQCRKALEYAFMQMNKPSKWKFNKARQNWIIRNLWSPEALPETYLPLTLKYLSKIQGGSRMKLVEEAQAILQPKETPPDPEATTRKTVKFSEPEIDSIEGTTLKAEPVPGPLVSTDPTPGTFLDSESMSTPNEPSSAIVKVTKTHALAAQVKMRAQQLLEVLSSHNGNA